MPKFRTYKELEDYINARIPKALRTSKELESIIAQAMNEAVLEVVYKSFEPKYYERRENNEGLSDIRNMLFTDFGINEDGIPFVIFENLTEGVDTLSGQFTTDTIVEGLFENWGNPDGIWADERDFIKQTAEQLKANPAPLLAAFKAALIKKGYMIL